MSDQRINLAGLADAIAMKDVYIVGADDDVLLAFVEAVEAAHKLDDDLSEAHSGMGADGAYERYLRYPNEDRFINALARFDFGERP